MTHLSQNVFEYENIECIELTFRQGTHIRIGNTGNEMTHLTCNIQSNDKHPSNKNEPVNEWNGIDHNALASGLFIRVHSRD